MSKMNKLKLISILLLVCIIVTSLVACSPCEHKNVVAGVCKDCGEKIQVEHKDYATVAELDMSSTTKKAEVTVKLFVDGDTVHFYAPDVSVATGGVLKARFLGIDTPESTGRIEEWGKKAAAFTKEKLSSAQSIIVESNDENWNADSTGSRYLLWIWYKPEGSDTYRNLNIDLLQNGLAIAYNTMSTRYGEIGMSAIAQAKLDKLNIQSKQPDPDFYYGDAVELTLKELRANIDLYLGQKVAFTGIVTIDNNQSVYVEQYDEETGMYYGMAVYYGYNLNGEGLNIIKVGNEARIVGNLVYYEAGGIYQVSGLQFRMMQPDDPSNLQKISDGHTPAYTPLSADTFKNSKVTVTVFEGEGEELEEVEKELSFAKMAMNTTVSMEGLTVNRVSTTTNEESSQQGAMTLYCTSADGLSVTVRTVVLYDSEGNLVTADYFEGKRIDVKGMIDYYSGDYQIKVFSLDSITIK